MKGLIRSRYPEDVGKCVPDPPSMRGTVPDTPSQPLASTKNRTRQRLRRKAGYGARGPGTDRYSGNREHAERALMDRDV
jgi:hypothetical protein